jgi:hypothetical protein
MMLPREVETGPDHQLTSLTLRNEPISSLVEHAAAHFLIGPDIGLTWTKLDDQAGDPPGFLGIWDDQDSGASICRHPPAINWTPH